MTSSVALKVIPLDVLEVVKEVGVMVVEASTRNKEDTTSQIL